MITGVYQAEGDIFKDLEVELDAVIGRMLAARPTRSLVIIILHPSLRECVLYVSDSNPRKVQNKLKFYRYWLILFFFTIYLLSVIFF